MARVAINLKLGREEDYKINLFKIRHKARAENKSIMNN